MEVVAQTVQEALHHQLEDVREKTIDEYFHEFQKDIGEYQMDKMKRKQPATIIPIDDLILLIGVTANRLKKSDVLEILEETK